MSLSSFELLRCLDLCFDTSADPALLLPFLSFSANAEERLEALLLVGRVERDEDLVVALVQLLKARSQFAALISPVVDALCSQFAGEEGHLGNVLTQLDCLPHAATSEDMIFLANLFEHGIGKYLTISNLETLLSDSLWSSNNSALVGSALLATRAILTSQGAEDAGMVKDLLLGVCNHPNKRVSSIARALLWEAATQDDDNQTFESLLQLAPSDPAGQTVDLAGLVIACDKGERYDMLVELLQRSHATQQGRALLESFVHHRIDVQKAGSCILFAVSAEPKLLLTPARVPSALRSAMAIMLRIVKRANAQEELCNAILEDAPHETEEAQIHHAMENW
jgi:hypothetical protein